MITHSEIVEVPIGTVWEHFLYKIAHPEHFVPGVSNVVIHEEANSYVIRSMDIVLPDGSKGRIKEEIRHSPYQVRFLILEHPVYTGYVDNVAEVVSEVETRVTFSMHWVNKVTGEEFANVDLIRNAVLKTVGFMGSGMH